MLSQNELVKPDFFVLVIDGTRHRPSTSNLFKKNIKVKGRQCSEDKIKNFIREECFLVKLECWRSKT